MTSVKIYIKLTTLHFVASFAKGNNMTYGTTGAKIPAATSSDKSGEKMEKIKGGVAMGKEDMTGPDKLFNTGRTEGVCYSHDRKSYSEEDKEQK